LLRARTGGKWVLRIRSRQKGATVFAKETVMGLVVALIVLAVIFGGIGLFVAAAKWALIIAVVLLIAGAVAGFMGRGTTRV